MQGFLTVSHFNLPGLLLFMIGCGIIKSINGARP